MKRPECAASVSVDCLHVEICELPHRTIEEEEACDNMRRREAHAEGEHAWCGPECVVVGEQAYQPEVEYAVQVYDAREWNTVSARRGVLSETQRVRDLMKSKRPFQRTRIVRWTTTAVVTEIDEEV